MIQNLSAADIDQRLEEQLVDGILYSFQEQTTDDSAVMLNGFGTIVKVVMAIGDYLGVSTMACIGGTNVRQDMDKLRNGVQLVVGTANRLLALLGRDARRVGCGRRDGAGGRCVVRECNRCCAGGSRPWVCRCRSVLHEQLSEGTPLNR